MAILVYDFGGSPAGSVEGSFNPLDIDPGFYAGGGTHSNRREMVYVNSNSLLMDPGSAAALAAHEFAHLIIHYQNVMLDPSYDQGASGRSAAAQGVTPEPDWLQEGLAVYAEHLCGYDARAMSLLSAFTRDPNWDLTAWGGGTREHYGASYSFISYLAGREGPDFIRQLVHEPLDGVAGINATLRALDPGGVGDTFDTLFDDWVLAGFLNNKPPELSPYLFTNLDVSLTDRVLVGTPPILADGQVENFGAVYLTFPVSDRLATFQAVVDGIDGAPLKAALVSWDSAGALCPEITRLDLNNAATGATVTGPRNYDRHTLVVWSRGAVDSDVSYAFRYSGAPNAPGGIQFLDLGGDDATYYPSVAVLLSRGVINGYEVPKGSGLWFFEGGNKVRRAQFAKMIMLAIGRHTPAIDNLGSPHFTDVLQNPPDYPYDFVEEAATLGIVGGYGNGKFGPYDQITRGQLVAMIVRGARAAGKPLSPYVGNERVFADVPVSHAIDSLYANVMTAYKAGILRGSLGSDGRWYLYPSSPATRNQVAKMTANLTESMEAAVGSR